MVVAWTVFLISLSAIPCWNKLASCAAYSNSLGALLMALAEFRARWSRDGNTGHCFSTIKWLKISHCQPFWMRSHAGSSLGTACPFSGMQPCWMALKNAVVWEAESGTRKEQQMQIQRERKVVSWLEKNKIALRCAWKRSWPDTGAMEPAASWMMALLALICCSLLAVPMLNSMAMLSPRNCLFIPMASICWPLANMTSHEIICLALLWGWHKTWDGVTPVWQ